MESILQQASQKELDDTDVDALREKIIYLKKQSDDLYQQFQHIERRRLDKSDSNRE